MKRPIPIKEVELSILTHLKLRIIFSQLHTFADFWIAYVPSYITLSKSIGHVPSLTWTSDLEISRQAFFEIQIECWFFYVCRFLLMCFDDKRNRQIWGGYGGSLVWLDFFGGLWIPMCAPTSASTLDWKRSQDSRQAESKNIVCFSKFCLFFVSASDLHRAGVRFGFKTQRFWGKKVGLGSGSNIRVGPEPKVDPNNTYLVHIFR